MTSHSNIKIRLMDKVWVPQEGPSVGPGQPDSCKPAHVMWVTANTTQPTSPCTGAAKACCRHCYKFAIPALGLLGQCMFGIAMLFIISGVALCIWGYAGTSILSFQIAGPICIGE